MCTLFVIWMLLDSTPSHRFLLCPSSVDSSHLIHDASSSLQYLCTVIKSLPILFSESCRNSSFMFFTIRLFLRFSNKSCDFLKTTFFVIFSILKKKICTQEQCAVYFMSLPKSKVTSYFCSLLLLNVLHSITLAVHGLLLMILNPQQEALPSKISFLIQ